VTSSLNNPLSEQTSDRRGRAVQAAGGLVLRRSETGPLVLVVHRPRYDDWSLPKGKLDPGETLEQCARREVFEETGFVVSTQQFLGIVEYIDRKQRPKEVHYWQMALVAEGDASEPFEPNDEVDEIAWLSPQSTSQQLTYPRDIDVLAMAGLSTESVS
jgi:8-oxo-dGTP pyrophosphatase MutT (NUDIX family)